ncbi:fasciclin domain-containing protein [Spirosoma sp. KCTC 42546]|uniref:fasciclin domain-containing protein n=1 Tax=Spirosoma sp. KCTC 42546 TaxID=2520506 RepID=UPI001159D59B|nr:fasciclin domain-containing protein [Spirosoma sp. KCTC 42546]QDK79265.1 fasciclin domain-containing protein [Spirosoma sp. KCTC 42546]
MNRKLFLSWAMASMLLPGLFASVSAQTQNSAGQTATTTSDASSMPKVSHTTTGKDLAISAAKSANHTVLFRALRASGLTEQAGGKGPYTVFAPTNEAFDKLPAGTMDDLLKPEAKAKLMKLLAYHVVKGKYTADQLQDGQKLKTVTGGTLTVGKQGDSLTITDGAGNTATVDQSDAEATNGMVYSIDSVLMPTAGGK